MKVLLIKPETVGVFALTSLVDHEPLELEYLYTVITGMGHEAVIYDRRHDLTSLSHKLKEMQPDVVCITGYITQEPLMIKITHHIKKKCPNSVVVIGGSHAENNYMNFYRSEADYIYHLSGLANFQKLMGYLAEKTDSKDVKGTLVDIKGICYRKDGEWAYNEKIAETPQDLPIPDRSYFYANVQRYRYLIFKPLALIKNSYSCPNSCNFCYCTNRNGGNYRCRSVESLVDEIASLDVPCIHITDDNFLVNIEYLQRFIQLLKEKDIHKKYLIYGRADFVAKNEELIGQLAEVGLSLIMVGLEATDDTQLDSYHKNVTALQNEECIRILDKYHVICAGLFIVHQGMQKKDFHTLYEWIAKRPIIPTVSVLTPMQGAANYKEYEDRIVNKDIRKQDLFHCILKPEHMSVCAFEMRYLRMSMRLAFHNRHAELYKCVGFSSFLFFFKVLAVKVKRWFCF